MSFKSIRNLLMRIVCKLYRSEGKSAVILLSITILSSECFAQLNESDSIGWQAKYSATGTIIGGNVARMLLLNRLEVAHTDEQWGISTRNDYQYGRTFYQQTENDLISYNFFYLKPLAVIYPYWMVLLETNLRRKINFRYQVGPGMSWNVIQSESNLVKLSITGTYEYSRFNGTSFNEERYNGSDIIDTWRITARIFGLQQLKKVKVGYEFWWQQSVVNDDNFRFHTENTLELPLNQYIALRTAFRYSYEKIQLTAIKPYDLFWTFGLTVANF